MRSRKSSVPPKISVAAKADLDHVFSFGLMKFGERQAVSYLADLIDLFDLLADTPEINRPRPEFGKGARLHSLQAHVVFYRVRRGTVVIERVLSRYQNWTNQKI
jgi:toxin ParE1/3/4